jgi:aspartyl-tRNA(Asn)/glutamyl-tRNA(Gln) amidotransferase subunit A
MHGGLVSVAGHPDGTGTVAGLLAAYRTRRLSPVEVLADAHRKLDAIRDALNPVAYEDREAAIAAARASEARWMKGEALPLDGVIGSVKSNVMKRGWPMRRGSHMAADAPMTMDGPALAALENAGVVILCQTTMPEFGWKGVGDSPLYGVTRNPHDPSRTTGGSSAGAGVLAALGIGHLHIGTDGLGSIRMPASFCGVFGIKASLGRVPAYPASPFGAIAHVGPMARCVADGAAMLTALSAPDARDITAQNTPAPDFAATLAGGVKGLRVAWSPRLGHVKGLDPEVEALCAAAVARLSAAGAIVAAVDPPVDGDEARWIADILWQSGAAAAESGLAASKGEPRDPGFVRAAKAGVSISAVDWLKANSARAALAERMRQFHERFDLLITPTMPIPAIEAGRDTPSDGSFGEDWVNWSPYTYPFNITGQPAATVPVGKTRAGLPVGLHVVGALRADALVMRASQAVEDQAGYVGLS